MNLFIYITSIIQLRIKLAYDVIIMSVYQMILWCPFIL